MSAFASTVSCVAEFCEGDAWLDYTQPRTDLDSLRFLLLHWRVAFLEGTVTRDGQTRRAVLTPGRGHPKWEKFHGLDADAVICLFDIEGNHLATEGEDL